MKIKSHTPPSSGETLTQKIGPKSKVLPPGFPGNAHALWRVLRKVRRLEGLTQS